jgi:hypothetical protein
MIALTTPREAAASDDDGKRHGPRYHGIDLQGVVTTQLLPNTFFGIDAAYVVGNETFQVRAGARVTGARGFELGEGKVANALEVGQLDVCAAKSVFRHRIRMCAGGQAGAMQHRWIGIDPPGRKITPYVAGTLKGDYRYAFTPRFGLLAGVGVSVPVVGPYFRGHDALGRPGPMLFPGPVAGTMTLGVSFSFI